MPDEKNLIIFVKKAGTRSSFMSNTVSYLKREEMVGKSVVDFDAKIIGTVKDLAVSVDGKTALQITGKEATANDIFIGTEEIQAIGDVVLVRRGTRIMAKASQAPAPRETPVPPFPGASKICSKCNYSNSTSSRFCIHCGSPL